MRAPDLMLATNKIVEHLSGSLSYGTNLPTSDRDIRGIMFVDQEFFLSPWHNCEEVKVPGEDTKFYELSKFMKLLVDQNPNIVESLWIRNEDVLVRTPMYDLMRANRELWLSSKAKFTYSGYAYEQMKRINGHHKWISNPKPIEPPQQSDYVKVQRNYTGAEVSSTTLWELYNEGHTLIPYGLNTYGVHEYRERALLSGDERGLLNTTGHPNIPVDEMPKLILSFSKQQYEQDLTDHKNYWEWKNNRNETRNELEIKYGYDTKHAMHLVRLLRTCNEILTEGVVNVYRPDAKELLKIREGSMKLEEVIAYAAEMEEKNDQAYAHSELRKRVNVNQAAEVVREIRAMCWEAK